ncbi:hypothetical protein [Streptomyces sp. NPDC021212]|uniref:hypothetical protein n=1 Tax=Streptomyces sp. NPDC021212 TaxID=3365118 RepID=UPI003790BAAF
MTVTLTYTYDGPTVTEGNARLRERLESYESGELTATSTGAGARTATSGATGNRPAGSNA